MLGEKNSFLKGLLNCLDFHVFPVNGLLAGNMGLDFRSQKALDIWVGDVSLLPFTEKGKGFNKIFKKRLVGTKCHILCNWIVTFFSTQSIRLIFYHIFPSHLQKCFATKKSLFNGCTGRCALCQTLATSELVTELDYQRRRGLLLFSSNSVKASAWF